MVKKSPASGNKPRTRKAATSAEAVTDETVAAGTPAWGLRPAAPEPEPAPEPEGVGLDGSPAAVTTAADETPAPKTTRRRGRSPSAGNTPANDASDDSATNLTNMTDDLVHGVERIERLAEEISALKDDMKEFFSELKSKGYSTKIVRKAIARRAMDPDKRKEDDELLELYEEALRGI